MSDPLSSSACRVARSTRCSLLSLKLQAFAMLALTIPASLATAQTADEYTPEQLKKHFIETARDYRIRSGSKLLELRSQPLMHWQNPVREQELGTLFVWSRGGRPDVFASVFTYKMDDRVYCRHEVLSLSDGPLAATLDGVTVWTPMKPGLTWKPITDVPAPSGSAGRRLAQMRGIARQFDGTLSIPNSQPSKLTLIPQPVLRYESKGDDVLDGAIFALAVATDPEIWLAIEARKTSGADPVWYFASARSHYHALSLRRNRKLVWQVDSEIALENTRYNERPYSEETYFLFNPANPLPDRQ
ncbi:MAG: hypothetical protein AAGA03_00365 [Planctomycetota bacterium]